MWDIFLIIFLIILFVLIVFLTFRKINENKKSEALNIIFPFNGTLQAPGSNRNPSAPLSLYRADGRTPQLSCPAGSKINIIGAYVEVYDPYGSCSPSPNLSYQNTCGIDLSGTDNITKMTACTTADDCGPLQECGSKGVCVPRTGCKGHGDCTDDNIVAYSGNSTPGINYGYCRINPGASTGTCEIYPLCSTGQPNGPASPPGTALNPTCMPGGTGNCRPRDASGYLAQWCDGKSQCLTISDPWDPSDPTGGAFGPLPCQISVPGAGSPDYTSSGNGYLGLPVTTSWDNTTSSGTSGTPPPAFKQGYYVHGIYTCIPDD